MKLTQYLILFISASLIWGCSSSPDVRPNVIVIMTDDQGYGDIAAHGNPYIETPSMDRLHNEAVRLENFHVCPTCSPTRAQLMTGKYNHRVGVWHTVIGRDRVRSSELIMAEAFQNSGYKTAMFGKWHLGDDYPFRPSDRGFGESVIHKGGSVNQMSDYWDNDRMSDTYYHNNRPEKYSGFSSDVFFNQAISFIDENRDNPFFLYLPTSTPHGPNNIVQEWADKYLSKGLGESVSNFYASIERADMNIGKLRACLKEFGIEENTILIFLTDNGSTMPNNHNSAGMRGFKGSVYEGGHRVPCFIYWPEKGLMGGVEYNNLTSVMDLLPTFIDICNLDVDKSIEFDGVSLKPLLYGDSIDTSSRTLLVENQRVPKPIKWKSCAIMGDRWRLVNGKELYDMDSDFGQKINVASENPDVVKAMIGEYNTIWNHISSKDDEYQPLVIGREMGSETLLSAIDWYWKSNSEKQNLVVGQATVREGKISNGIWPVQIDRSGEYTFELRRWPKESKLALNASAPEILSENNDIELKKWGSKPEGRVFNIVEAKLRVNDLEKVVAVNPSDDSVDITVTLESGLADIQTWFYTTEGDTLGAYYVYLSAVD